MTVSGVFLGEMNANVGIKGGCQFLGNMSGQQVLESFCLSRKTQKPRRALQSCTERHVGLFVRKHSCACAHKHSPTPSIRLPSLSHTLKPYD